MKTAPDCLPCLLNRVLETVSRVAPDPLVAAGRLAVICNDLAVLRGPLDPAALVADAVSRRLAVDYFVRLKEALATTKAVRRNTTSVAKRA